jgi:tRNA(Ile)-lysidine synthase
MLITARTKNLPQELIVAVSGGADSMAALDYLKKGRKVTAAVFDHGTGMHDQALPIVLAYCNKYGIPVLQGKISSTAPPKVSPEEHWRNERYAWLRSLGPCVVTGHHLDDVVETWLWGSVNGQPKLIPWENNGIYRPFLQTTKSNLVEWCEKNSVKWLDDPSNMDVKYTRNKVRKVLVPAALQLNPGLYKVVKKKLTSK